MYCTVVLLVLAVLQYVLWSVVLYHTVLYDYITVAVLRTSTVLLRSMCGRVCTRSTVSAVLRSSIVASTSVLQVLVYYCIYYSITVTVTALILR